MTGPATAAIILAAGKGSRMASDKPKVMHEIGARPMLAHVIDAAQRLNPERLALVIGDGGEAIAECARSSAGDIAVAVQSPPMGTGDAVRQAMPALDGFSGVVLVLYADTPLITAETLRALASEVSAGADVAVLAFEPLDPAAYGRIILGHDGSLEAIVEAKDASEDQLRIGLCNSGVMALSSAFLTGSIGEITNQNAKGEYYLTDLVAIARAKGSRCAVVRAAEEDVLGVNSRSELAAAEAVFQNRRRAAAMNGGATLIDPQTVHFSWDTKLGRNVSIGPNVVFGAGVVVEDGADIKAFCHIEGAKIGAGASIGPFARLRPGAEIGASAKIGNFVEVKKADIGAGAKVSHLSYIGDAEIGAGANIGAGTITCNYDGYRKHITRIGENAFIGSNTALVAPVSIGAGAYVGSGSVITKDVEPDDLAVARGRQAAIKGWAARFRKTHQDKEKS
ncbi:MAG: bifunctional UDP-N-acetylglucosamine diphosphorylase/glucosamine-1-phosphate N-acetyltransferase GlmU [Pseudomonadota bacterium]